MSRQRSAVIAVKMICYIYMFLFAPALTAHMISFGGKLADLICLVPLMIFAVIFGFSRFWNMLKK